MKTNRLFSPQSMASSRLLLFSSLALLLFASSAAAAAGYVGGRTEIKDAGTNKEVQELGRFCVEEYKRQSGAGSTKGGGAAPAAALLSFRRVVKAEQQVVAGMKYYLTIAAKDGNGKIKMFDAVVVVQSWRKSKELLSFTPSAN